MRARLSNPASESSTDPEAWEVQSGARVPKFSEDPQHREIADENAPFDADWFMVMERSLETGSMAHCWDEIAKTWFVKVAMESLKTMRLLKQIVVQMLERRNETWNLVQAKMDSAPKGIPPLMTKIVRETTRSGYTESSEPCEGPYRVCLDL